jgi:hypothetical protein
MNKSASIYLMGIGKINKINCFASESDELELAKKKTFSAGITYSKD